MNEPTSKIGRFISNYLYKLTALTIKLICRINGTLEVRGKENFPSKGGIIIAPNHISYLDPPIIGSVSPRRVTFMAKKALFDVTVLGSMIKHVAYPVDRDNPQPSTIKETIRRLKSGQVISLFPEGTRSETGELQEGKRGIGVIASLSKVPVIPALIVGSDKALPLGAKWLKKAKITVVFGKPIYYTSTVDGKECRGHQLHDAISKKIMSAIKELKTVI